MKTLKDVGKLHRNVELTKSNYKQKQITKSYGNRKEQIWSRPFN